MATTTPRLPAITLALLLLACTPTFAELVLPTWIPMWRRTSSSSTRNIPPIGFANPLSAGGSFLTQVPGTYPEGQGEPINIIISGNSDPNVLIDAQLDGGLRNYFLSFGFSGECLGQHSGSDQGANLGDGNGIKNETSVIRWNYYDPQLGSCKETVQGGNHFRYWVQDGPSANTGAIFLAASYEKPIAQQHDIIPSGYSLGRDWLIGNITQSTIPTANLTNGTTYSGSTSFGNYTYQSDIQYLTGYLANTNDGINHNVTVGVNGFNASDGFVALINVKITATPPKIRSSSSRTIAINPLALILSLLLLPTASLAL